MSRNKLVIGGESFEERVLLDGSLYISNSLLGDELSVDTLDATVDGAIGIPTIFKPKDANGYRTKDALVLGVRPILRLLVHDLTIYTYGEPVHYYRGNVLFATFYMKQTKRVSKYSYSITCTSATGLLDGSRHYGGIYEGTAFSALLADIIGGVFSYTTDVELGSIPVYGWLKVNTRRENLQQLLFAEGVSIKKNPNGSVRFTVLDAGRRTQIPDDRLFLGGGVDLGTPITAAEVSEHSYIAYAQDKSATLYDGESPAEPMVTPKGVSVMGVLVEFSGPVHDLTVENGEILESGVNYAVLGPGSGVKLVGQEYTHTVRIITTALQTRGLVSVTDNIARVSDATLVSLANSENVAARVLAYYSAARMVSSDLVTGGERPGDAVSFTDPFDEPGDAFIQSMDIAMSNTLKAASTLVVGFVPTPPGNYYTHSKILINSGSWVVPEEVKKIRVALISGGQGGAGGGKGEVGTGGKGSSWGNGGEGGPSGPGGPGGRIYVVTVPVTPGQRITFKAGVGGAGGQCTSEEVTAGTLGTDTVFGTYSTVDGKPSDKGFGDLFGGGNYALPGESGISGGKGSGGSEDGPGIPYKGVTYAPGQPGQTETNSRWDAVAGGGKGGGAAAGASGGNGGDGSITNNMGNGFAQGGHGGAGGKGLDGLTASVYGSGGAGGHGGGGGGGGGGAMGISEEGEPSRKRNTYLTRRERKSMTRKSGNTNVILYPPPIGTSKLKPRNGAARGLKSAIAFWSRTTTPNELTTVPMSGKALTKSQLSI